MGNRSREIRSRKIDNGKSILYTFCIVILLYYNYLCLTMYNNYCLIVLGTLTMKAELLKMNLLMYFILTSLGSSEICVLYMFLCQKEFL